MKDSPVGVTGIIPFTYFGGVQRSVGSTFLRVDSLIKVATDFECWQHGKKYENLIFQKSYWIEMMELFTGPKVLDICDPDWIRNDIDLVAVSELVHAITCSSPELTKVVKKILPKKMVFHVADRLLLNAYPISRITHQGPAKNVVWFGFIHNAHETLYQLVPSIIKFGLRLTIISDKPYSKEDSVMDLNPHYIKFDLISAYKYIQEADIVLNPKSEKAFYKYKSNNKSIISWQLGMPVAYKNEDILRFIDSKERNNEVLEKQRVVKEKYAIEKSAEEYRGIIKEIRQHFF